MKECKFCKNVRTGDDYYPLISNKIDFGFFGTADNDVYLSRNPNGKAVIIVGLVGNYTGETSQSCEIDFCPICGKELNERG